VRSFSNTYGDNNTAIGYSALGSNTGDFNIALGYNAGSNLTTGDNNIAIGSRGVAAEFNTIRIGAAYFQTRTFVAGIRGVTTVNANAVPVVIDSAGQLGTLSSSQRFIHEIKRMHQTSEVILALQPVTFQYKSDKTGTPQFGLIAEEVAKVNPDLVVRDEKGEIYSVRYEAVNAMLLNEFLKEHRRVKELKSTAVKQEASIAELKKDFRAAVAQLTARLEEQQSRIRKVSAQLQLSRPAPETVVKNQ
jgi:hypothetical protein